MDLTSSEILSIMDTIVETESGDQTIASVNNLRLRLDGRRPSLYLKRLIVPKDAFEDFQISDLESLGVLLDKIQTLVEEKTVLEKHVADLTKQLQSATEAFEPHNGCYTMNQFMSILAAKRGCIYAWRISYLIASNGEDCQPVANETIQKWQATNEVPIWAVEQIGRMVFPRRRGNSGPNWSDAEEEFLCGLYIANPREKNLVLAQKCQDRFQRQISDNSIKGALDRARKRGLISKKRPKV